MLRISWLLICVTACDGRCFDETLWVGTHVVPGYHALCFDNCNSEDQEASCPVTDVLSFTAHWNGVHAPVNYDWPRPPTLLKFEQMLKNIHLANPERYNALRRLEGRMWNGLFAFFRVEEDKMPVPIHSVADLTGTVLVFEGGTFVWPGVHVNFTRRIALGSDALSLDLLTRSLQPLIIEISSFVTEVESEHLIKKASKHIEKSPVSLKDKDKGKEAAEFRTSSQYFLPSDDSLTQKLDKRVSALTLTSVSQQEYIQMLRYEYNERYAAHHDYFDPKDYVGSPDIMQLTSDGRHNRLATVFFYLSTVESGGETNFPRSGGLPQPLNFEDCSRGVSVQPVRGRIILFYSMDAAAQLDVYSLHGGCAVKSGTKWSANKWIWSKKMNFLKD